MDFSIVATPRPGGDGRRDGLLHLLLGPTSGTSTTIEAGGHLLRMLKNPATKAGPPGMVAVSQGAHRIGDLRDKDFRAYGDEETKRLEGEPTSREGLLPAFGLAEDQAFASTTNAVADLAAPGDEGLFKSETKPVISVPDSPKKLKRWSFPPTPPREASKLPEHRAGPWWRELLASPAKRLRFGWDPILPTTHQMADLELPPPEVKPALRDTPVGGYEGYQKPKKKVRKDLPSKPSPKNIPKANLRNAVKLALAKNNAQKVIRSVEENFYANSSRAAKVSRRKTVSDILKAGDMSMPLTPNSLKFLVGTLKESGYKSSAIYLAEAKTAHIEQGHDWSHLLDRNYKLCMAASKRGAGPKKKAIEVSEDEWSRFQLLGDHRNTSDKVQLPAHLFACGVHWMMREIELAALKTTDIKFDEASRRVSITWRASKADAECRGISRTLQCICNDSCDMKCPYATLEVLVNNAVLKGTKGGHVAVNADNHVASKSDIVKDWQKLFNPLVTGHSTRRSGALQYIRKGWSISQVGYLGRWKSSIIMEYAQEALESLAINSSNQFGHDRAAVDEGTKGNTLTELLSLDKHLGHKADKDSVCRLKEELEALRSDSKGATKALSEAIATIEGRMDTTGKYLPPLVRSGRHQVVHKNVRNLVFSPRPRGERDAGGITTWPTTSSWKEIPHW